MSEIVFLIMSVMGKIIACPNRKLKYLVAAL